MRFNTEMYKKLSCSPYLSGTCDDKLDFGAYRKLRERKRQLLDIPAWPVRRNTCDSCESIQYNFW